MLQKYYEQLLGEVRPQLISFQEQFEKINISDDFDMVSNYQQHLIQFGTKLEEKYHIEETEFIKGLETIVELLYEMSVTEDSTIDFKSLIIHEFELMDQRMNNSISVCDIDLSLVLVIKDEAPYIMEWLEFHRMLGVEHFYIYDNESSDGLMDVLAPYIEAQIVTYHFLPGHDVQIKAYDHALLHYKYDTRYMGFIDTDEFLFPVEGESLPKVIDEIINDYHMKANRVDYAGGIGVNWRVYGTGGHISKPNGLVIESYRKRGLDKAEMNELIKVICNPTVVKHFEKYPHNVQYGSDRIVTISENGSTIPRAYFYDSHCEKIRINHYYTKSEEEYHVKVFRRGWTGLSEEAYDRFKADYEKKLAANNDVEDYIMERFVEKLKNRLEEK